MKLETPPEMAFNKVDRVRNRFWLSRIICVVMLSLITSAYAASFEFLQVEDIFTSPPKASQVQDFAIAVASSRRRFRVLPAKNRSQLNEYFVFQTRVKIGDQIFYRLAIGNFSTSRSARVALQRIRTTFADAWIYKRSPQEATQLARYIKNAPASPGQNQSANESESARNLLVQARQEFIDKNYARVIAITDKVITIGSLDQLRAALELAGTTRERQGKFSQAIVLYESLIDTKPPSDVETRIKGRLEGIRTMGLTPKSRLKVARKNSREGAWNYRGIIQQYYQADELDRSEEEPEALNRVLVTDIDLFLQRRTDIDNLVVRLDIGLVNDFLADTDDSRISNASIEYARDSFSIIGGRQSRTLTGLFGRFDGIAFKDLSHSDFILTYAYGFHVDSTFDGLEKQRPFLGFNLDLQPYSWLDLNFYLITQEIYDLTDRQAIGSEFNFHNDVGFIYGFIDYDIFFERLNNLSMISNYRLDNQWSFNLTLAQGNSPYLSTINALQGQAVNSVNDLKDSFSESEIYDLAEDRTSESRTIFFGVNYIMNKTKQIYFNYSSLALDETTPSGGVGRVPSSSDQQLSVDYLFQGLLTNRDYASLGTRFSDSTSSETISLRMRTRLSAQNGISYDPRLQLDHRRDKDDGAGQTIVKPSLKLKYRASKKLNFEGIFEIEYSKFDLPDLDRQYIYSFYLGYYYLF
jgi:hypothetical protein